MKDCEFLIRRWMEYSDKNKTPNFRGFMNYLTDRYIENNFNF